jgi:hypothetical protein
VWGFFGFSEIDWTKALKSSLGYSVVTVENANLQSPDAFRQAQYALANLRYYPADNITVGMEYQYGRRDNFSDGFHSVAHKIHLLSGSIFRIK